MESLLAGGRGLDVRAVSVRPTWGAQEHRRWDQLVATHHYLSFQGLFGKGLRHVATLGSTWIALVGWQAGALKLTARDRWIGWSQEQKLRRLHLVTQNSRFVILPGFHVPNLASRVLGLSLRRLSEDMLAAHGHPVLVAETFVDPARFAGTCYRAANWRHHGQRKEILVFELQANAGAALRQPAEEPDWQGPARTAPPEAPQLRSVLVLAVAARLAGYRGVTACAQFAGLLSQQQRQAADCFYSPSRQCYTSPSITTFHNILASLPPETLETAVAKGARQQSGNPRQVQPNPEDTGHESEPPKRRRTAGIPAVSMDGKDVRGASRQTQDGRRMLVAAIEHGSGLVRGQLEIDSKTNEIPAVRELADAVEISGCTVTVDALHAQHKTARHLLEDCGADYLVTAIKDNQPTLLADLQAMLFGDSPAYETRDKEHGRSDRRRYWVKDLSDSAWEGYAGLYGRRQAIRIERQRQVLKTGASSTEVTYALTSLTADKATAEQLAALVRNHWHIENRLHYVRDFTYDEDRCRVYVRDLPRNLACLTNTAISIVRCQSRFQFLPEANRHFAARPQEALDLLLNPPAR